MSCGCKSKESIFLFSGKNKSKRIKINVMYICEYYEILISHSTRHMLRISGVRLGPAQRGLAGRLPLRDEPRSPGRGHRNVLCRHDRLLLLRQEEPAQQIATVSRARATKLNCLRHNAFLPSISQIFMLLHVQGEKEVHTLYPTNNN